VHLTHLFNHCLRLGHFPAPWTLAKIITLPKPGKDWKISPKFTFDQPLVCYGQTISEADFKNNPKTHWWMKLTKCKSLWLSSRSQYDTSMYEFGGSYDTKFQHVVGCCVLGIPGSLRYNTALWSTI
jgi:hypothetical protein